MKGWQGERYRHSASRKGIKTATLIKNKKYGGSGWGNMKPHSKINFNKLKIGDIILNQSDQFNSLNVMKVIDKSPFKNSPSTGVLVIFVNPTNIKEKRLYDDLPIFIWDSEFSNKYENKYFKPTVI